MEKEIKVTKYMMLFSLLLLPFGIYFAFFTNMDYGPYLTAIPMILLTIPILSWIVGPITLFRLWGDLARHRQDLERTKYLDDKREADIRKERIENEKRRIADLDKAVFYIDLTDYEKAIEIYEKYEMWDEVKELRIRTRQQTVKHIYVNGNEIFDKIKSQGLAIPYKCPNCSGTLKITGNEKFQTCPYCDSNLDIETLSDLVRALL